MATIAVAPGNGGPIANDTQRQQSQKKEEPETVIPEFIDERRKDSEGRITVQRFHRGKLLGKVRNHLNTPCDSQRLPAAGSLEIAAHKNTMPG